MTIDEAIKHCLEVAERNTQGLYDAITLGGQNPTQEEIANCEQCASDHRQLAEWLTELKEAKRLLKLAVTCLNDGGCTKDCDVCTNLEDCIRKRHDNSFKWRYTDEVKELIND